MTELNQYLTFCVDSESYAINVTHIQEVLELQKISRVPRMPEYMRGIINLRGSVVPVFDLKTKFGLGKIEQSIDTSIIVTELITEDESVVIGLLADSVNEVVVIREDDIEPTVSFGTKIDSSFIQGIGKISEKFIILLKVENILGQDQIRAATATGND